MSIATSLPPVKRAASLSPEECRAIAASIKRDIKRSGKPIYKNGTDEPDVIAPAPDYARQKANAKRMTLDEYRAWERGKRREKRKMKAKPTHAAKAKRDKCACAATGTR